MSFSSPGWYTSTLPQGVLPLRASLEDTPHIIPTLPSFDSHPRRHHDASETFQTRAPSANIRLPSRLLQWFRSSPSDHSEERCTSPDPLCPATKSECSSSESRSTPSCCYDENAENINPNEKGSFSHHNPSPSRPTNILCDSQAYPILASPDATSSSNPFFPLLADKSDSSSEDRSTPSYCYDENAENIAPSTLFEAKGNLSSRPSQSTNVLCDSQSYGTSEALADEATVEDRLILSSFPDSERRPIHIVAPIPLPYTARSEYVLAAMFSNHASNVEVVCQEPQPSFSEPHFELTTVTDDPQARGVNSNCSVAVAEDTYCESEEASLHRQGLNAEGWERRIRPISPVALSLLTDPLLMAWAQDVPSPRELQ